jgi:gliding motility associated protien GldN
MKNNKFLKLLFACALIPGLQHASFAQEADTRGYNPMSVRPIHESDIMYKKTVWQIVDLREKQNRPFMAVNNEITKVIFDAVKAGLLQAYNGDSVKTPLALEDFIANISAPGQKMTADELAAERKRISEDAFITAAEKQTQLQALESGGGAEEYPPSVFTQMELKEDVIFDKQRSRLYWDTQVLTIFLPADKNGDAGVDKPVASFRYKDLARVFKSNPNAIWFNAQNNAHHLNLADAFELRKFSGRIIKISNPNDEYLYTTYEGDRKGLLASDWIKQQIVEFEHNLWEF